MSIFSENREDIDTHLDEGSKIDTGNSIRKG